MESDELSSYLRDSRKLLRPQRITSSVIDEKDQIHNIDNGLYACLQFNDQNMSFPFCVLTYYFNINIWKMFCYVKVKQTNKKLKSVAYSSQGNDTGQLNFCNFRKA